MMLPFRSIVPIVLDGPIALCCGRLLAECDCNVQSVESGIAEVVESHSDGTAVIVTDEGGDE